MRKDDLYQSVKRFRKEDFNAFVTTSSRIREFKILCCAYDSKRTKLFSNIFAIYYFYPWHILPVFPERDPGTE